ncbi:hypothetical protein BDW62DRAFT_209054 [Aspergillus aurantiobrunneus]
MSTHFGFTFVGTVMSTGPNVDSVKPGDRKYALALEENTLRLDPKTTFEDASRVIASRATVISAVNIYMGLSLPPRVLIYGGSSAVGGLAVKYTPDAGYDVVTTSSTTNRKLVERRNATHIIDHCLLKEDILRQVRAYGPYEGIFEATGSQATTQLMVELLREPGGQFFSTGPSPGDNELPQNVQKKWAAYSATLVSQEANRELCLWWYLRSYLPEALKNGLVWPA